MAQEPAAVQPRRRHTTCHFLTRRWSVACEYLMLKLVSSSMSKGTSRGWGRRTSSPTACTSTACTTEQYGPPWVQRRHRPSATTSRLMGRRAAQPPPRQRCTPLVMDRAGAAAHLWPDRPRSSGHSSRTPTHRRLHRPGRGSPVAATVRRGAQPGEGGSHLGDDGS